MVLAPLAAGPVLGKVHAMKTMRRLIYTEVLTAVGFVTLAFLGLFFFFDLVEDLQNVAGRHSPNYQLNHALVYVALLIPIHVYELMPITVLIGCIFVMARMAQSSEFTILRTSGMGPGLALRHLMLLGLLFALLTFVMGDHIAPWCEREGRLLKSRFEGGVFTNLSHDHLDYHETFAEYRDVKKSFFDHLPKTAFALSNSDDKNGAVMLQNTSAKKKYYSLKTLADVKGKLLDNSLEGLHMSINDIDVHFKLIGEFNAYNLLAVYASAISLGQQKNTVLQILSNLTGAEGRFDYIVSQQDKVMGIVDYAHTPDALLNVLATIKELRQGHEKIISVIGCGGN